MDAVYMARPGPIEELRYSLRSLAAHVTHDRVWLFGTAPAWLNTNQVTVVSRPKAATKYATTTAHIRAMCEHPGVSDPFVLWMDDVYAVRPIGEVPLLHLGPLAERIKRFQNLRSAWGQGMRATADLLTARFPDRELLSYEVHAPLVVHKAPMIEALAIASGMRVAAPHKRTLYGNLANLPGVHLGQDPKWVSWSVDPPSGDWLSSDDTSFRGLTGPILRWLFPAPCVYERVAGNRPHVPVAGVVRPSAQERMEARRAAMARRRTAAEERRTRPVPGVVLSAEDERKV